MDPLSARVMRRIRDVPDFPSPGILFKDITPVLADAGLTAEILASMAAPFRDAGISHVAAIESRGFILGMAIAQQLGAGFVPIRKPGKLPWETVRRAYALEYGENVLEMHRDAFTSEAQVLVVDDVLATGGTAAAAVSLIRELGGTAAGLTVMVELPFLSGRQLLPDTPVHAIVAY